MPNTSQTSKRGTQAVMMSNANNTMSSLSVSHQHSIMNKDRKSIDVVKKSNVLSNLIYKPIETSANAMKSMTYHSISPQNRFNDSFTDTKLQEEKDKTIPRIVEAPMNV